eukprot:1243865-Alexandrium_andersonii.AAC.1
MAPPGLELARQAGAYRRRGRAAPGAEQGGSEAPRAAAAVCGCGRLGRVGVRPAGGPGVAAPVSPYALDYWNT